MNILAGNATDCCQRVEGVGEGVMEHGALTKNGRIFVVEEIDEHGNTVAIVAQSWIWRNKDVVCFDNIEIPVSEHKRLKESTKKEDIQEQQEILEIYQKVAEQLIVIDRKTVRELLIERLKKGEITQGKFDELYQTLALKSVTIGTGYNDLGILEQSGLARVDAQNITLPRAKEFGKLSTPWIDSGVKEDANDVGQMPGNDGGQLYLARAKDENGEIIKGKVVNNLDGSPDIEDLGVEYLYRDSREVIHAQGRQIDMGVISNIKKIENIAYRNAQKILSKCVNYEDIADMYEIDPHEVQVMVSNKNGWYMIYTVNENSLYIADVAMLNGLNSQKREDVKTDAIEATLEYAEYVYSLMLESAKQGKSIKLEAIEDTSYKNIMNLEKKGVVKIEDDTVEELKSLEDRRHSRNGNYAYYDNEYDDYDDYEKGRDDDDKSNLEADFDDDDENGYGAEVKDDFAKGKSDNINETTQNAENPEAQQPIIIHNMTLSINQQKLEEELNKIRQARKRRSEANKISSLPSR